MNSDKASRSGSTPLEDVAIKTRTAEIALGAVIGGIVSADLTEEILTHARNSNLTEEEAVAAISAAIRKYAKARVDAAADRQNKHKVSDPISACASAALSMAITAAKKIALEDPKVRQHLRALEALPHWVNDPTGWEAQLSDHVRMYGNPDHGNPGTHGKVATRSLAETILLRACHDALRCGPKWDPIARQRNLVFAGMNAGILFRIAYPEDSPPQLSAFGKLGAAGRLAKDPKQAAMKKARALWDAWQADQSMYPTAVAFAQDACEKFDLESVPNMERNARKWKKQAQGE